MASKHYKALALRDGRWLDTTENAHPSVQVSTQYGSWYLADLCHIWSPALIATNISDLVNADSYRLCGSE